MSRRIRTFSELDKIEEIAYREAVQGDLFFVRYCNPCIDGYFLIVSRDDTSSMKNGTYYIREEDFAKWSLEEKKVFKWRYGYGLPDDK